MSETGGDRSVIEWWVGLEGALHGAEMVKRAEGTKPMITIEKRGAKRVEQAV
eukprot:CAMPEP_0119350618 /NCGR_PEP_ID=MMETSP1333-20130426/110150_1 /TAXON_ID=418940 /ORGANISM="Scyphosphaera apsteinii, Strain RCC1455" /LENGTH=51 /DNA_ID=CAMNT_0007363235 /DNA_START=225 /DNA_END=380 /DNA_ORIENTATION=+